FRSSSVSSAHHVFAGHAHTRLDGWVDSTGAGAAEFDGIHPVLLGVAQLLLSIRHDGWHRAVHEAKWRQRSNLEWNVYGSVPQGISATRRRVAADSARAILGRL